MVRLQPKRLHLAGLAFFLLFTELSFGAFCALRDPVESINAMYPTSTGYKSIVRSVGAETRAAVLNRLSFTLHFNELGRHTLYVAMADDHVPLGLVHVRSELVNSGLIEFAWAMHLDYSIARLELQRCRQTVCKTPLAASLKQMLIGKNHHAINTLLENLPATLRDLGANKSSREAAFVEAALRSALKTLAVTELAWHEDIVHLQRSAQVALHFEKPPSSIDFRSVAHAPGALQAVRKLLNGDSVVVRESIRTVAVMADEKEIARFVEAEWQDQNVDHRFRWLIDNEDRIVDISPDHSWPNIDVARSFDYLVGKRFVDAADCASAAEVAAFEITYVSAAANR